MGSFMKTLCFLVIGFSSLNFLRAESRLGGPTFVFRSTATQNGTMVYRFQSTQNPSGTVSSSSTNVCQEEIECKTCECSSSPKPSCRSICVETTSETRENNRTCTSNITCNSSGEPVESSPTCSCDDGYVDINGSCQLIPECSEGYVWDSTSSSCVPEQVCVPDTSESQSCYIENGEGTQSRTCNFRGLAWGPYRACAVTHCNSGYGRSGNSCVPDCRPGYHRSGNRCVPDDPPDCAELGPVNTPSACCTKSACKSRETNGWWWCWTGPNDGSYCP